VTGRRNETTEIVVVTDEMIEAAQLVLSDHYLADGAYDLREPCLKAIFLAMDSVRPK